MPSPPPTGAGEWLNRLIYGDYLLAIQALLAGNPQTGLPSLRGKVDLIYVEPFLYQSIGNYPKEALSFIAHNVVTKEEGIRRKVTGKGLMARTNRHLFENQTIEPNTEAAERETNPADRKFNPADPNYEPADQKSDHREWKYILLPESKFYALHRGRATQTDICNQCNMSLSAARGSLFDEL